MPDMKPRDQERNQKKTRGVEEKPVNFFKGLRVCSREEASSSGKKGARLESGQRGKDKTLTSKKNACRDAEPEVSNRMNYHKS